MPALTLVSPMPRSTLPSAAQLVVEIPQTSHARDREQARDCAAAGVPEYLILDLPGRAVGVHRDPQSRVYTNIVAFGDGAAIRALSPDAPPLDVSALLG